MEITKYNAKLIESKGVIFTESDIDAKLSDFDESVDSRNNENAEIDLSTFLDSIVEHKDEIVENFNPYEFRDYVLEETIDSNSFLKFGFSSAASVANLGISVLQGLGELTEGLLDAVTLVGALVATEHTAMFDAFYWIACKMTGAEFTSLTKNMWEIEKIFVSKQYVKDLVDDYHQDHFVGEVLEDYSFSPFKSTGAAYKVIDKIGYIAGIIGLSILTCGVAGVAIGSSGAAVSSASVASVSVGSATANVTVGSLVSGGISATAGFGKNTESAWNDGANELEGLLYGTVTGLWEGFEMVLGHSINSLKLGVSTGVKAQLLNTSSHVVLDSIDGATSAFTEPLFQMLYKPNADKLEKLLKYINYDKDGNKVSSKTWKEASIFDKFSSLFKYNGGVSSVAINAVSAGIFSFLTEIPDVFKSVVSSGVRSVSQSVQISDVSTISQSVPSSKINVARINEIKNKIEPLKNTIKNLMNQYPSFAPTLQKTLDALDNCIKNDSVDIDSLFYVFDANSLNRVAQLKELFDKVSPENRLMLENDILDKIFINNMGELSYSYRLKDSPIYDALINMMNDQNNFPKLTEIIKKMSKNKLSIDERFSIISDDLFKKCNSTTDNAFVRTFLAINDSYQNGIREHALLNMEVLSYYVNQRKLNFILGPYRNFFTNRRNKLVLDSINNIEGTPLHEFGHAIHSYINDYQPKNLWDIIKKSRENALKNESEFENILNELFDKYDTERRLATNLYNNTHPNAFNKMLEYVKNCSSADIENDLKYYNIAKETIEDIRKSNYNSIQVANVMHSAEVYSFIEPYIRIDGIDSFSDMVSAVYASQTVNIKGKDIVLRFSHKNEYWSRNNYEDVFCELMANYNSLVMTGNDKMLDLFEKIFGKELLELLETVYYNIGIR